MQEVARSDPSGTIFDGVGPGWAGIRAMGSESTAPLDDDIIPSDPVPEMPKRGAESEGAHAAEDEEVARVQAQAASTEGAAEAEPLPDRNSPSPVIIWRHAAPVKIATNVPADLLGDSGSKSPSMLRRHNSNQHPASESSPDGYGEPRRTAARPVAIDPRRAAAAAALNRRMAYGVWYLPKEQWESRAQAAGQGDVKETGAAGTKAKASGGASGSGHAAGSAPASSSAPAADGAEGDGTSLAEQIPKLYSSRIYKDYLKEKRHHRMPHYLQRVESPKQSLSSRRGGIPMLADGTAAAEGGVEGPS
uniref:Uncharacterized protein n=1 Tax=Haptolina brevifila TaxID=156173 RepID=A0A7S2HCT3_9EUKA